MRPFLGCLFRLICLLAAGVPGWLSTAEIQVANFLPTPTSADPAIPTAGEDATAALQRAFDSLKNGDTLVFPAGETVLGTYGAPWRRIYRVSQTLRLAGKADITIRGNHGVLLQTGFDPTRENAFFPAFEISGCKNLKIADLAVDLDRPPFSPGKVTSVAKDRKSIEVAVDPAYPVAGGEIVQGLLSLSAAGLPDGKVCDYYAGIPPAELLKPQLLRLKFANPCALTTGQALLIRHQIYRYNAFTFHECDTTLASNLTVFCAAGMGFIGIGGKNLTLDHCVVMPPIPANNAPRRPMSTAADAVHCTTYAGSVTVTDCRFEQMGDDGVNVHAWYLPVTAVTVDPQKPNEATVVIQKTARSWYVRLDVGDILEFSAPDLLPRTHAQIRAVHRDTPARGDFTLQLAGAIDDKAPLAKLQVGDLAINMNRNPVLNIKRTTVKNNRARGVLCQTFQAQIEDNTFDGCSGPAIMITCDNAHWTEAGRAKNVVVAGNRITHCNTGAAFQQAAITIFADIQTANTPAPVGVHRGITLRGNTIHGTDASAIYLSSVDGVTVTGNRLSDCCQKPRGAANATGAHPIYLQNAAHVTFQDNQLPDMPPGFACLEQGPNCTAIESKP